MTPQPTEAQTQRRSKYRAIRTNGYASKREANRAAELQALAKAGIIKSLREQPRFELIGKDELGRAICYVGDFAYTEGGKAIVEDVKGFRTEVYKPKRRLMFAKYGIKIQEV